MPCALPALLRRLKLALIAVLTLMASPSFAADAGPTPIADVKHDGPVDFEKEILPILKKNCTACHNKAKAENDLSLESPETILKGGSSGPGAVGKKGDKSLIVTRAAVADDEQMPPAGNKVGANRLTSTEIGLLKLWIDQGATGTISKGEQIAWQPLSAGVHPILAVALTPDGQYAACSRGNQIFVYHVPSGRVVSHLSDPALLKSGLYDKPGVADLDLVRSLAFSPDGETLSSGGFRTIKLWKRSAEAKSPYLGGKLPAATTLAVASPDRKLLAFVQGNDVQLADLAGQKLTQKLSGHTATVTAVAFSADGTMLVTASTDKAARVWNTADGKLFAVADVPAELTAATITNDGTTFVVGAADGKCRSFAIPKEAAAADARLAVVQEWPAAGKRVTALAPVMGNPTQVVVGDDAGNVVIWNTPDVKQPVKAMQTTGGELRALAVTPNGAKIVGLGVGNSLRVWNIADGKQTAQVAGDVRAVRQVALVERNVAVAKAQVAAEKALLADAEKLATAESEAAKKAEEGKVAAEKTQKEKTDVLKKATDDKANAEQASAAAADEAKKADEAKVDAEAAVAAAEAAEKGAEDAKAAAEKTKAARAVVMTARKAAIDAGTKAKAAVAAFEKTLKPFDDATKAQNEADSLLQSSIRAIASAAAASKRAAAAVPVAKKRSDDAEAMQQKVEADLEMVKKTATGAEKPFRSLTFSPDGKLLAVGGDDCLVHTFDAESAAPLDVFVGHGSPVVGVVFAGDDRLASIGADGAALAWTLYPEWTWSRTIGDPTSTEIVDRVTALDFSPDGKLLASGGGAPSRSGELKIWNPADGTLVREVADAHSDTVFGVRFSPDGKTLASGAADKFLKTFDVASGKFIRSFEGHTHHVLGVSWSADGRLLATAGADNAVKSWDVNTGEQKKTIAGFGKEVTAITFVGATNEAIASGGDKTVRMLNADTGQMGKQFAGATGFLYCCAVSTDGKVVAAGGKDGILHIWDVMVEAELKNFPSPLEPSAQQAQK
jgi:WD40 repeat protein